MKPCGVGGVLADVRSGVVLENAVEHVERLARRAGDGARGVDADLVGGVRVDASAPARNSRSSADRRRRAELSRSTAKRWPSDDERLPSPQTRLNGSR